MIAQRSVNLRTHLQSMESFLCNLAPEITLRLLSFLHHEEVGRMRLLCHAFRQLLNRETQDLFLREIYRRLTPREGQERLRTKVSSSLLIREIKAFCVSFPDEPCTEVYQCLLSAMYNETYFLHTMQYLCQGNQLDVITIALLLRLPHTLLQTYLSSLKGKVCLEDDVFELLIPYLCRISSPRARLSLYALRAGEHLSSMSQIPSIDLPTFQTLIASGYQPSNFNTLVQWCYHSPRLHSFMQKVDRIRGALKAESCPFVGQFIMYKLCFFSLELGYQLRPDITNNYDYTVFSRIWYGLPFEEEACPHRELSIKFGVRSSVKRKDGEWRIKCPVKTHVHIPLVYLEGFATCVLIFFPQREFRRKVLLSLLDLESVRAPCFLDLKESKVPPGLGYVVFLGKYRVYFSTNDTSSFSYPRAGESSLNFVRGVHLFCNAFSLSFKEYCEVFA